MKLDFKNKHPIVLLNFPPRIIGHWFVTIILWSGAVAQHIMSPFIMVLLGIFLLWPLISLFITYHSKNPKALEFNFVWMESILLGVALALLGFSLWPVIAIFCGIMVVALSLNGFLEGFKVFLSVLVGAAIAAYFNNFYLHLGADLRTTLICIIGLIAFMFNAGFLTYFRNQQGKRDRKKLRAALDELDISNNKLSSALNELDQINKVLNECSSTLSLENVTTILVDLLQNNVLSFDTLVMQSMDKGESALKCNIIVDQKLSTLASEGLKNIKIDLNDQSIILDVFRSGKTVHIRHMDPDNSYLVDKEIQNLLLCQSAIIFPIVIKNKTIGVLGLYSRNDLDLDSKQIETASNYINQVSLIINNAILHDQMRRKRLEITQKNKQLQSVSTHLAKYIPPQLFDKITQGQVDFHVGANKKMMTVFFSDIVHFTEISDTIESEKLTIVLNIYLKSMTEIVLRHGGTIDKYIGDAIMVFFGDPSSKGIKEDAHECALMALEMRDCLNELRKEWAKLGIKHDLEIRMGMHTGNCAVGNFGSEFRMDYTIIGSSVNLASRLLTSASPGQIVISEETYLLINDTLACKENGLIRAKGFSQPIMTHIILGN